MPNKKLTTRNMKRQGVNMTKKKEVMGKTKYVLTYKKHQQQHIHVD